MLSTLIKQAIEINLSKIFNSQCLILNTQSVGGGCINESYRINTTTGDFFIKWNEKNRYPGMFEVEVQGLELLKKSNTIHIPRVIAQYDFENTSFLILEWIESGKRIKNFGADFGEKLAKLHSHSTELFGLDQDNYIGSLPQSNKQYKLWKEFFIQERLIPPLNLAVNSKLLDSSIRSMFDKLFSKIDSLIPEEKPALLHGDLWSGNYLVNQQGAATLIDPAVYYGHREIDLAMTKLFGGFNEEFYSAYQIAYPIQPGFNKRVDVYNLYPLLVHVNLFGGSYAGQLKNILKYYS